MFLSNQFGFRNGRTTIDALAVLEHEIYIGSRLQQVTVVVTLDLSSALDLASSNTILYQLARKGLEGKILMWLENFLKIYIL